MCQIQSQRKHSNSNIQYKINTGSQFQNLKNLYFPHFQNPLPQVQTQKIFIPIPQSSENFQNSNSSILSKVSSSQQMVQQVLFIALLQSKQDMQNHKAKSLLHKPQLRVNLRPALNNHQPKIRIRSSAHPASAFINPRLHRRHN